MHPTPLIPAEAGTQFFGQKRGRSLLCGVRVFDGGGAAQTWVPASAGMSGE